jgi:hypothetical protein
MSIDTRLSRLAPALSAQERAILVLQSWKEGNREDPNWRLTMPANQGLQFNHYISLMNAANQFIGTYAGFLECTAKELALRQSWYMALTLWQEHLDEIARTVRLSLPEPITESEYRSKVEAGRAEWVEVGELAGYLAGGWDGWTDDDYEEDEEEGRVLTDAAWDRVAGAKEAELRALVARGALPARGKGRGLKIQAGAFDDYASVSPVAVPEDHLSYRVLPDAMRDQVEQDRLGLKRLKGALSGWDFDHPDQDGFDSLPGKLQAMLRETIAHDIIVSWIQVRCAEIVLDEVAAEFNGADPLRPHAREKLDATRERLLQSAGELEFFNMAVVLREPLPEELDELRGFFQEVVARET